MNVPTVDDINAVFEANGESLAEVGLGRVLPLAEWPRGEARWITAAGSATASVVVAPDRSRVEIELRGDDLAVSLAFETIASISVVNEHGIKELIMHFEAGGGEARLRVRPDIDLRSDSGLGPAVNRTGPLNG